LDIILHGTRIWSETRYKIKASTGGSVEQYWTYSEPMEVWCNKKTLAKIMKREARGGTDDIAFYNDREKLKLFKRI